jgi:3-oxoacyl-[acyl-carrier-protein] synthase III
MAHSHHRASDVDLIVSCSISRYYDAPESALIEPGTALRLRQHFGFNNAIILDISNACAGIFTGLYLVDALLRSGAIRCGLVVSGEFITHITQTAQREIKGFTDPRLACLTLGDSGLAMMLELGPDDRCGFRKIEMFTLSEFSDCCVAKTSDHPSGGVIMLTDMARLSSAAIEESILHSAGVIERLGLPLEHIDHFICHQTSKRTLRKAMDKSNEFFGKKIFSDKNTIINLRDRGNTATTSQFLAFQESLLSGRIKHGHNILFSINGSGMTVGTAIYTCDNLLDRICNPLHVSETKPNGRQPAQPAQTVQVLASAPTARIHRVGVVPFGTPIRKETYPLCRVAAEQCLNQSTYDRNEIDLLIFTGVYRTDNIVEPAIAAIIAKELGLGTSSDAKQKILCFDVADGSAGMVKAIHLAAQMIQSGQARLALIVASEIEPNASLDGQPQLGIESTASALLLEPAASGSSGFGSFTFHYFPEHINDFRSHCDLSVPGGLLKIQKDPRSEDVYLNCICVAVEEYFAATNLDRQRVACVLAPQISSHFIARLESRLGLSNRIINAVNGDKNLYSSSFAYAWSAFKAQHPPAGDVALVIAIGAGLQVICASYHLS